MSMLFRSWGHGSWLLHLWSRKILYLLLLRRDWKYPVPKMQQGKNTYSRAEFIHRDNRGITILDPVKTISREKNSLVVYVPTLLPYSLMVRINIETVPPGITNQGNSPSPG